MKEKIKTYTRKDIEHRLGDKLAGKQLTEKLLVDSLFECLREVLLEADPVSRLEIRDFGVFEIKKTKPKPKARNMQTGEFIFVPGRRKIHFKPGKIIRDFLKEDYDEIIIKGTNDKDN
ncbi:MAG TPA: HU family DNA-binding protein [Ignavibacteria bacterium]|nr:HU family DNA-binding protein [Ignavibacteria bacterium]HQY51003.1 HU family DNA-binding protein [Ignavibacteria bacterium]HQY53221.1 HU family DNA-binding protein [Ignavibacteria bacterium]HRA99708.1 HU family DNA-binding protein [Ignavibacteria bacterium]